MEQTLAELYQSLLDELMAESDARIGELQQQCQALRERCDHELATIERLERWA